MAEYIEREALIKMFSGGEELKSMSESLADERFVSVLKQVPTVDVVEVVMCEKCKHAKLDLIEKGLIVCRRPVLKNGQLLPFNWETKYNDFCSYGELKEREGNDTI